LLIKQPARSTIFTYEWHIGQQNYADISAWESLHQKSKSLYNRSANTDYLNNKMCDKLVSLTLTDMLRWVVVLFPTVRFTRIRFSILAPYLKRTLLFLTVQMFDPLKCVRGWQAKSNSILDSFFVFGSHMKLLLWDC
jgi:hypothetical protein